MPVEGKEECVVCKGGRYRARIITLYEPCNKCGGRGEVIWIDNVVGGKSSLDDSALHEAVNKNISVLICELRHEGMRAGFEFEIVPRRMPNPCSEVRLFLDEAGRIETEHIAKSIGFFPDDFSGLVGAKSIAERIEESKKARGFPSATTVKKIK